MAWWRVGGKKTEPGEEVEAPAGAFARLRAGLRKTAAGLRGLFGAGRPSSPMGMATSIV